MRSAVLDAPVQQISNIHPRPEPRRSLANGGVGAYWASNESVAATTDVVAQADGTPGVRSTRVDVAAFALYNSRVAGTQLWQVDKGNMNAGDTYTIMYTLFASINMTIVSSLGYGTGASTISGSGQSDTILAGRPLQVRRTVTFTQAWIDLGQSAFLKWNMPTTGAAVGDWFEISSVCVMKGVYLGAALDGNSPGWHWLGAANDSESAGPQDPSTVVYNQCTDPRGLTSWATYLAGVTKTLVTGIVGGPGGTTTGNKVVYNNVNSNPGLLFPKALTMGITPVTISVWVYRDTGPATELFGLAIKQQISSASVAVPLNSWTRLTATLTPTVSGGAVGIRITNTPTEIGSFIVTNAMIVQGTYDGEYSDNLTPGWSALADGSSKGPKYTLESVAGALPLADMTTPGFVTLPNPTVTKLGPMSMYVVAEHLVDPAVFGEYSTGLNSNGGTGLIESTGFVFTRTSSTSIIALRMDTAFTGPGFNQVVQRGGAGVGRHVIAGRTPAAMTTITLMVDSGSIGTGVTTPNSGVKRNRLLMDADSSYSTTLRLIYFETEHSDVQARDISRWLGNKYGLAA